MGTMIRCCMCDGRFDERELEGDWLSRRCPRCGKKLSEEAYDRRAARVGKRNRAKRDDLALARFYTSEWFRLARAGQGSEAADKGLSGLKPRYSTAGRFMLEPSDRDRSMEGGLGIRAEYQVYDAIRSEIAREGSPLAGSRLVPHLVFDWLAGQKPKQWGAKHRAEIDCVLLTRSCAVVVEVKRHAHHVRVSKDFRHVRERNENGSFKSASEPIEQVQRAADSFAERQRLYPPDRIFKMLVFVEPHSFTGGGERFVDGQFASYLDSNGNAHFVEALCDLVNKQGDIAGKKAIGELADHMLEEFGNTADRRRGSIVGRQDPAKASARRRTNAMLAALAKLTRDRSSALYGSHVFENLVCEVQMGKREQDFKPKRVEVTGLLLTRSFAFLIDAKRWPVHVNTHAPFATVYTGDPDDGAEFIEDSIRHEWDLDAIHYKNRSGSLTLLNYVARSLEELDEYRQSNRVCTLNVFVDPYTFCTDGDTFRQRTYIGYWNSTGTNVFSALEQQVASAPDILTPDELDRRAESLRKKLSLD